MFSHISKYIKHAFLRMSSHMFLVVPFSLLNRWTCRHEPPTQDGKSYETCWYDGETCHYDFQESLGATINWLIIISDIKHLTTNKGEFWS